MEFEFSIREMFSILQSEQEADRIEAKRATGIGSSMMQTICAFANTPNLKGGYLLLGVSEPDQQHDNFWISGVENADNLLNELQSNCRDQFEQPITIFAQKEKLDGKLVIAVYVPELDSSDKPCTFKGKFDSKSKRKTGVWLRGVNGDYEAAQKDLEPLLLAKTGSSFEQRQLADAEWEDLDPNAISRYRELRAKVHPNAPELDANDQEMLYALSVVDRKNNYKPNIAGLVVFGKALSLRRLLPSARIDYVRVGGVEWVQNDFIETFDLLEPLIFSIVKMENKILSNLPYQFRLEPNQLQRSDTPLLPYKVIRETLVNAVMHKDYQVHSPIIIAHYNNRLEVKNAGYSLKPQNELGTMGSNRRNHIIAQIFYDLRFAENKGSGIGEIYRELKQANLQPPKFDSNLHSNHFQATYLLSQLLDPSLLRWLGSFKQFSLNQDEVKALVLAFKNQSVSNEALRELSDLNSDNAGSILKQLANKDLLQRHGIGRGTTYSLTEYAKSCLPVELIGNTGGLNTDKNALSVELNEKSSELNAGKASLSVELNEQSSELNQDKSGLPAELREKLLQLGQRSKPQVLQQILVALCQIEPMSLLALAKQVNRNEKTLRPLLSELIKQGSLQYRYPEQPTHPQQAYIATEPK